MAENGVLVGSAVDSKLAREVDQPNGSLAIREAKPNPKPSQKRPDYRKIHALPLPLVVHALPSLNPQNPLSLLHIAYVYLKQTIWKPSSIPTPKYVGYFSTETQSIHVTDAASIQGLWRHGFFGKGSLSRSEPTWLEREKRKRGLLAADTSEEYTRQRREQRRAMKLERARLERQAIEDTLQLEQGTSTAEASRVVENIEVTFGEPGQLPNTSQSQMPMDSGKDTGANATVSPNLVKDHNILLEDDLKDEEHLQLMLEEAFFLACILGVLEIRYQDTDQAIPFENLLPLCMVTFQVPQTKIVPITLRNPDNPFIISYVAYHHFRSLGWVVKSGNKFAVDFLLYLRGPVFAHAEFAVAVLPSYEHEYWSGKDQEVEKPWYWFHMLNRVQSSVRKTLVLCYVDIPPPSDDLINGDNVEVLLKKYKIREFVVRRWSPNRNRG